MSQEKNSVLRRSTRYVSGGITEVGETGLEWWERNVFYAAADDRTYIVERRFEGRLDQIAAMWLNDPRMWWVIAQYNSILDPFTEVKEGAVLYIPTIERAQSLLNGKTGGIASTRQELPSINPIV